MSSAKRDLNAEEAALWARVTRAVKPLSVVTRNPAPPHIHHASDASSVPDRSGEKRVRRGKLVIDAALDLHGFTQERAHAALRAFLMRVREEGARVVIVVTGKGGRLVGGEAAPGVLKRRLPDWLAAPDLRPLVAGFAPAHTRHGGGGAFYVFLRRPD